MSLHCFKRLFLYFTEFYGHFPSLNLAKLRDTVSLKYGQFLFFLVRKNPCGKMGVENLREKRARKKDNYSTRLVTCVIR